jgi:hypothetical protein
VTDDAAKLLLRTRQKSWHVFESNQRNIESIAETLMSRTPARKVGVVRHDSHWPSIEAGKSQHNVFRKVFVDLEEVTAAHPPVRTQ